MLLELGERLLECADDALLDAPLDALDERVGSDEARDLLTGIHEAGDAGTLRQLLSRPQLERWQAEIATEREQHTLGAQLRRWLGDGEFGGDDPARLAIVEPLPETLEALLTWARPYALLGELSRPASEVLAAPVAQFVDASLIECCLGGAHGPVRGQSALDAEQARRYARAYLMQKAAAHDALRARAELWAKELAHPSLRALAERVRAAIAGQSLVALHAVVFVPARPVQLELQSGTVTARVRDAGATASFEVRLFLSGHEQRALHAECERCQQPSCLHVRALAARIFDACVLQSDRLHAALCEFVRVPSWRRFLRALEADTQPASEGSERLGFRVRVDGERVGVAVVQQGANAAGGSPAGKLASPRRMLRSAACCARDRPVLEAMVALHRSLGAQFVNADLSLLRALCEHPFVQLEGSPAALRVEEQNVHVALLEQPEGSLLEMSLGSAPLPPGPRAPEATFLPYHDRNAGSLVFAPLTPSLRRLLQARAHFHGVLPPESYPLLAPWVASLAHVARVSVPKALRGSERTPSRKLLLRITPGFDEGVDVALTLRALPLGALWPPGQGPELVYGFEDGAQVFARRDLAWERDTARRGIETLELERHAQLEPFAFRIDTTQAALGLLAAVAKLSDLLEIEWAERARPFKLVSTIRSADLAIRFFKKGQWLKLEGGARIAGGEIAVARLLEAARHNERFVLVSGGDYAEIEGELLARLQQAQLCVTGGAREPSFPAAATRYVLQALGPASASDDPQTAAFVALATQADTEPVTIADPWQVRLRDYQRDGVRFLLERSRWAPGVCLADEMGLGKTVQAIALLEARAELGAAMVLAPTSVTGNWLQELARFAPSLRVRLWQGTSRASEPIALEPGSVLVLSYDVLLRDRERFAALRFATQIVDEAQAIKNAHTQRAKAVAEVQADFRVALSGTPVENRLGDLWSLFQLLAPGLLGSWARFRSRFAVPIERYEKADRAAALRALIGPLMLRRTKREVATELPSRTEVIHRIELSPAEQDLYDSALRHARRALGKRDRHDPAYHVQILAELTRLRQLACHPRLVIDDERLESSKLTALMQLLHDIVPRGHRVLLFSQFTAHLALVREAIAKTAITQLYLDGSTPAAQRTRLVQRFQEGEGQAFLISLKAGGTGLNLTAADYVVHLDPWWNPAAEDQASDRAHRIGQERPLTIVKLVSQGTIEEHVLGLHGHKRQLAESVLADSATASKFDMAAIEALLSS